MAVNELNRDYLRLLHICDHIEDVIAGQLLLESDLNERKKQVGNMVMHLEVELLDDKWIEAGKDLTRLQETVVTGRAYWKSAD